MASQPFEPHIVFVPFMAQGHISPMFAMAHHLAIRGAKVTFITTPLARIAPFLSTVASFSLSIDFVQLQFPSPAQTGLPEGYDRIELLTSPDQYLAFYKALAMLRMPLHQKLIHGQKPDCIISDYLMPWTAELARDFSSPRFVFHGPSTIYLLSHHYFEKEKANHVISRAGEHELFVIPGMRCGKEIRATKGQIRMFEETPEWKEIAESVRVGEETADGIILNSFMELEMLFIEEYQKAVAKPVWPIGPLSLCSGGEDDMKIELEELLLWLDSKQQRSVVYVCFGSLAQCSPAQVKEIKHGLEATGRPFIWAVKEREWTAEMEGNWAIVNGLLIKGWAPQIQILNHPAVGGFLTHCGWNSVLEAVAAGIPTAVWPRFGDQFINAKLLLDVLSVSVAVAGADSPPEYFADAAAGFQVGWAEIVYAVESMMDGGDEVCGRRARIRDLKESAGKALCEGGSSSVSVTAMMKFIRDRCWQA